MVFIANFSIEYRTQLCALRKFIQIKSQYNVIYVSRTSIRIIKVFKITLYCDIFFMLLLFKGLPQSRIKMHTMPANKYAQTLRGGKKYNSKL